MLYHFRCTALPQTFIFSDGRRRDGTFKSESRPFLWREPWWCWRSWQGRCEGSLLGRRAIGCLERRNESIRVLRGTRVRHITATQGIEKIPRPRAYGLIVLIAFAFAVAVTVTNELVAFEPADAQGAAECATTLIGEYGRSPERGRWWLARVSSCNPLRLDWESLGLGSVRMVS